MWDREERRRLREEFRHRRPPWWPENETWPPQRHYWQGNRKHSFRRVGCLVAMLVILLTLAISTVLILTVNALGLLHLPYSLGWAVPASIGLFFLGMALLFWTGRSLRRMYAPLGDLVDAAERISEGDYSQQVSERGSPDMRSLVRAFNGMVSRLKLTEEQRRDLMADIAHELRTPLTVIQGNLEGMIDGIYSADESHLKSVLEETQVLSRLVDDLRTLALAESGALQLKKEPTDLSVLVGETVSAFRAQADAAGIHLEIGSGKGSPVVAVDPERMRQVLSNLISNAMRYTHPGGVIQVGYGFASGDGSQQAFLTVKDNGEGISADVLPNVFNRFVKSRDSSGTGLGLPIARHLVEAHGGIISIESQEGQGTTIHISLPMEG